jgi:transposase InsO family protein
MDQKIQFMSDYLRLNLSMSELCQLYNVSRKTGYKWVDRYLRLGPAGLEDRSRTPLHAVNATAPEVIEAILETRRRHPSWGGKKLLAFLHRRHPRLSLPHRSTVCDILKRHKGHFRTGNGLYCYALTVADGFSRYLLGCQALGSTAVHEAQPVFTRLFQEFGLPRRIRTDNGVPFATHTLARLSRLSAWWVRLSILPELIEPGCPQQNGRHERMHRTLKAETTRPPAASRAAQQRRFDTFRAEFNHDRPHEALDMQTPASCYLPSPRPMPARIPPLEYPDRFEVRYVSANGGIRWNEAWVNVSTVCAGQYVGLEEIDDGVWNLYYSTLNIGRLDERTMKIEDAFGRLKRKNV